MLDGATYDQHDCRVQTTALLFKSAIFIHKNIIINAKANKYQQNHNQTILP